jgi:ABC-type transport system involved in Fe-S cluster assembly fused permease/ATPase subunit
MNFFDSGNLVKSLSIVDYAHNGLVGLCFTPFLIGQYGSVATTKSSNNKSIRHYILLALILVNVTGYSALAATNLEPYWVHGSQYYSHSITIALNQALLWSWLAISLRTSDSVSTLPHFRSLFAGFCLEALIGLSVPFRVTFDEQVIIYLRVVTALGLVIASYALFKFGQAVESPITEKDDEKKVTTNQEHQFWKVFRVSGRVLRILWPHDRKTQFLYFIGISQLVSERALNILIPKELGSIVENLTQNPNAIPWKPIGLWIFYRWFGSWSGFRYIGHVAKSDAQDSSRKKIRDLAFTHVMNLSMDFHSNKGTGEVIKAIDQAESLNNLLEYIINDTLPMIVDLMISIWWIPNQFGLAMGVLIFGIGVCYVWSGIILSNRTEAKRKIFDKKSREDSNMLFESMSNWETVSNFNRLPYERERYLNAIQDTIDSDRQYLTAGLVVISWQSLQMHVAILSAMVLAVWQIRHDRIPVGSIITLLMYWETLVHPMRRISDTYRYLTVKTLEADRLLELLDVKGTIEDAKDAAELVVSDRSCKVTFKDVHFAYDDRKETLRGIDFHVESGQTVAFVGETGSGKSTIFKLLFRHYDVTQGAITINDQDIRSFKLSSLRDALGLVPQNPTLFNTTILENIRYARLDATDDEIMEVCKAAAVHEKIMSFAEGYQTIVGERGVKLSGGELQRIAIARILLKDPKIVLLDEATSAIDSVTESQIQKAFKILSTGRTTFVIAHRLSTIITADLIMVMDKGEIVERGTHNELVTKKGKYAELWSRQSGGS